MLLLLLTIIAVLVGVLASTAVINARMSQPRKSGQPSVPNRQVSLLSLVLFLFFPWGNTQNDVPL